MIAQEEEAFLERKRRLQEESDLQTSKRGKFYDMVELTVQQ